MDECEHERLIAYIPIIEVRVVDKGEKWSETHVYSHEYDDTRDSDIDYACNKCGVDTDEDGNELE